MNGKLIRVGKSYAVHQDPHKGVEDKSTLYAVEATVKDKNVARVIEDEWGAEKIKKDGILATLPSGSDVVLKGRDFLMPWSEYEAKREERKKKQEAEEVERAERVAAREARWQEVFANLSSFGLTEDDYNDTSYDIRFNLDQMEKFLLGVSHRQYELVRDADLSS